MRGDVGGLARAGQVSPVHHLVWPDLNAGSVRQDGLSQTLDRKRGERRADYGESIPRKAFARDVEIQHDPAPKPKSAV